ncbi:ABC transmembrane type-1 domain-containing protein [Hyphomicrobiales bacterium]|nr:ABC transmembrane type-1 domain-containing protein [Hyphomicrobiales bacterium]CAH1676926.1 ABC transmembrane type-1 domain-containing protein [Hyphomicrobiales bacterium]
MQTNTSSTAAIEMPPRGRIAQFGASLGGFLLRRLLWAIPVILAIIVFNFILTRLAPGDPLTAIIGEYPVPPDYAARIRAELGLDQPILLQLLQYLARLLRGDFGYSFANREAVLPIILNRSANTLTLMIPGLIFASALGILFARLSLKLRRRSADGLLTALSLFGFSVPVFWFGQILILLFAVELAWFPAQGMFSMRTRLSPPMDFLSHWALPGFVITIYYAAIVARVAQASMKEAVTGDFVMTAMSKGASERRVFWRHVFPNALIPIASVIGNNFGLALTGAILVETVFAWPGVGSLFMQAIVSRDYPTMQGIFILAGTAVVLSNILTDLLYSIIDPRVHQ